jgi:hypothetical protein
MPDSPWTLTIRTGCPAHRHPARQHFPKTTWIIPVAILAFFAAGWGLSCGAAPKVSLVLSNDAQLKRPGYLASDGTKLYVRGTGADSAAHIYTVPLAGGPATHLYAAQGPIQVALLGTNVFWIDPNSGPATDTQIWRAPADGSGTPAAIYTGAYSGQPIVDGSGLASDGVYLYAADEYGGAVWRLSADGSGLTQVAPARFSPGFAYEHLNTLTADQGTLYIAGYGQATYGVPPAVVRVPATGGSYTTLASSSPLVHPVAVAVGNGMVYVTDDGYTNTIWQVPVTGGAPSVYLSGAPFQQLGGLCWVNGDLYVSDSTGGAIYRISQATSPAPSITSFSPIVGSPGTVVTITGENLTGATNVAFNGVAAEVTSVTATQIVATVPTGASKGVISVSTPGGSATSARPFFLHTPGSLLAGPVYPPPLGLTFGQSGTIGDGSIGRASGQNWYFTNVNLSASAMVYWGTTNGGVRMSFLAPVYPNPPYGFEILNWSPSLSSLGSGVVVWAGQTHLPSGGAPVYTRFTLRLTTLAGEALPLADAASAGVPSGIGGVVVVEPATPYKANLKFEASYSPTSGFVPALDFYDTQTPVGGSAYSSFTGGFYYEDTAPVFLSNPPNVTANRGTPVPPVEFNFTDTETGPNSVGFSATSSNLILLPNPAIQVTRTGNNTARVYLYPTSLNYGQSLVTIYAFDGMATNSRSFVLTVNDPPTISDIPDQLVNKGGPVLPIAFNVADNDSTVLTLTAGSTNLDLVPLSNIEFNGTGSSRMVTVTPAAGQFGKTLITVTVSDGMVSVSDSFLLTVNDPPQLTVNQPLALRQGDSSVINTTVLSANDAESAASQLMYTIGFGGNGGPPHEGSLTMYGTNLVAGSRFTQDDLLNNRLTYQHNGLCSTQDDFQFNVSDSNGGVTPTGQYVVYSFRINIAHSNRPPVVMNSGAGVGLGAGFSGAFHATNTDCSAQTLTFRIIQNGTLGTATLLDPLTGAFSYAAAPGSTGTDTVLFQVNDGTQDAVAPGQFSFNISNQPPVITVGSVFTRENLPVGGTFSVQDPDLPAQAVACRLVTLPGKGTLTMTGPLSYLYTPNPRAIGEDSFSVIANDGLVDSAAATFTVNIRPNVDPGDIVFSDAALKRVMLVDPSGAHAVLSQDQLLTQPHGLAVEANRNLLVLDEQGGLIRIDCVTGQQSVLSSRTNFANDPLGGPLNLVIERSGMILVADGANGIVRVHPVTGAVSPLASGGHLVFPKGITVSPVNGDIYAGDLGLFAGQTSGIVRIDPITGLQTLVSSGGNLMLPAGLAMDNSGRLFVADPASFAGAPQDSLLQVDPVTGVQTVLATTGLKAPMGVATAAGGRLVLPNNTGSNLAAVARSGGEVTPVATGALMQAPFGIAVVHYQALDQPAIVGGHFTMRVTGEPGETYPIESTADFQSWTPAGSALIPLQGTITYSDPSVTTSRRFYRLIVP